jgi:hypothetical protein
MPNSHAVNNQNGHIWIGQQSVQAILKAATESLARLCPLLLEIQRLVMPGGHHPVQGPAEQQDQVNYGALGACRALAVPWAEKESKSLYKCRCYLRA